MYYLILLIIKNHRKLAEQVYHLNLYDIIIGNKIEKINNISDILGGTVKWVIL